MAAETEGNNQIRFASADEAGAPVILIVDDEPSTHDTLEGLLFLDGYNMSFASSGVEALEKAAALLPDLILLDVMMPGMDGFEVCRRIRADSRLAEAPIIMVTVLDDRESRLQGLEAGADDFITKPFDSSELRARVRTTARLNRYRRLWEERVARERAEELARRRAHELITLQEANESKSRFVSDLSHELRTQLSVITFASGNLDTLYDHLSDDERRQMVREIRDYVRALDTIIGDVLELARIESGQVAAGRQRLDLGQLAREEIARQTPLAQDKFQTLRIRSCAAVDVRGNDIYLRRVVRNLIHNAIKYTGPGGDIVCACDVLTVSPDEGRRTDAGWPGSDQLPAGRWGVLQVIDSGIGISEEDLPHVFERFYRVKNQGSAPGTGLGLAIVKELVELHAGYVGVASHPGKGSTFAVYLPVLDDDEGEMESGGDRAIGGGSLGL
jgi:signal transduction histidine kinase